MTSKAAKQLKKDEAKRDESRAACSSSCAASIANLLEEHRAAISADFKAAFTSLEEKLTQTEATVADHGRRITSVESGSTALQERMLILEQQCTALADSNAKLAAKAADLEGRSRRNNLRIIGLPESIEGPRPTAFFSDLLVEMFGRQILQSPPELDRAHRALTARPPPGAKPRAVIIRFHRYQTRELVVQEARKRRGNLQYQGKPIRIFEDYTPEVLEQRTKYREVMSSLYNLGLKPSLLFPARLMITLKDGSRKGFSSPADASEFVDSYRQQPPTQPDTLAGAEAEA